MMSPQNLTSESGSTSTETVEIPASPTALPTSENPAGDIGQKRASRLTPKMLSYLMAPVALPVLLLLMHLGATARESAWLWVGVFVMNAATSAAADYLYAIRPSRLCLHLRIAQNIGAVAVVIYLSGWGPEMGLAFAFVAIEIIAHEGFRVWRVVAMWSMFAIAIGQLAIVTDVAPSQLTTSHANALSLLGAIVLLFVMRMAGITMEQKEAAQLLVVESEDRYRSLIQNSSDTTMVITDGGMFTYISASVTSLLGYEPSELIGRRATDFVHDDDRKELMRQFEPDAWIDAPSVSLACRMTTKVGTFRHVEAVVTDQRDRPSVGGYVANVRDVTERAQALQELQDSQKNFRLLFEEHPHPMYVFDLETLRFLEVNQCATEDYGYTRDEFLDMSICDIRPEEDVSLLLDYLENGSVTLTHAGIWHHRTKAGQILDVEITTNTLEFNGRRCELVMAQDVSERCRLEQQLRDHALYDSLTGLPNRSLILDRVDRLNAQAKRTGGLATVVSLNLDCFALINEAYGRDVGDELICAVGERLVAGLREVDTVGRVGGDEFVVLALPPPPYPNPGLMAQKVLDLIGSQPFRVAGRELNITASVGIKVGSSRTSVALLQGADIALHHAKAEGGNCFVVFAPAMRTATDERLALTMDLRDAVSANQMEVFYQPVVRLEDMDIIGVEALVRWRHPTLGLVPPIRFIPLAESTGVIGEIGRFVLRRACEQAAEWQMQHRGLSIAVNVSVFQLRSETFVTDVMEALERSHLNPGCLILEVTESILIHDFETALTRLKALKALGVRLSIDDFGTGYSSLNYLRQFPFDILKVDQSFIASMVDTPEAVAMVETIFELGRQMKLEIVAEGVEETEQLDILQRMRCISAQGYLFSRPIETDAMSSLLVEWPLSGVARFPKTHAVALS